MRLRIALTALLTVSALAGNGGVAIGASALSTEMNASAAQYGQAVSAPTVGSPSAEEGVSAPTVGSPSAEGNRVAQTEGSAATVGGSKTPMADTAQAPRQVQATSDDDLPFTGLQLVTVLLAGLALLTGGLVMLRLSGRAPRSSSAG